MMLFLPVEKSFLSIKSNNSADGLMSNISTCQSLSYDTSRLKSIGIV